MKKIGPETQVNVDNSKHYQQTDVLMVRNLTDELLVPTFAASRLRMELDRVPLWRGDHVAIKQLVEDFGRYLYLPRLRDSAVLLQAIREGVALLTWEQDAFAYADSYDEAAGRYRGLRGGQQVSLSDTGTSGLLVKPEVARRQLQAEIPPSTPLEPAVTKETRRLPSQPEVEPPKAKRFHGTVTLDTTRVGRDASRIADEVIAHLAGLLGSTVKVTLEIEADMPGGAPWRPKPRLLDFLASL